MTRLQKLLDTFEEGLAVDRLNGWDTGKREQVISDLQRRYDHLAGVPIAGIPVGAGATNSE
jgi:hypothetical protein